MKTTIIAFGILCGMGGLLGGCGGDHYRVSDQPGDKGLAAAPAKGTVAPAPTQALVLTPEPDAAAPFTPGE